MPEDVEEMKEQLLLSLVTPTYYIVDEVAR